MRIAATAGAMWERAGLIGDTGFVGGILASAIAFARRYNSRNIDTIAGESFDVLVCAGAPATMWAANADPEGDRANLDRLSRALERAHAEHLVLISTIAVFDDAGAGYSESRASYETNKAYGRNRRELELRVQGRSGAVVVRLPALFGPGLKKNFVYDVLNPVPSFVKTEKYESVAATFSAAETALAGEVFRYDEGLGMMRLDRTALQHGSRREVLEAAFERAGFLARSFTNSDSRFQYYNLLNLRADLERCLEAGLAVVNICSEPWRAGDLHAALTGTEFVNPDPPLTREDMRTDHAAAFGRPGPYLYGRDEILADLRAFAGSGTG